MTDQVAEDTGGGSSPPSAYPQLLADIKTKILRARTRAALSVNSEMIRLYWEIGRAIVERQRREGWGAGVIVRLAGDLRAAFPGLRGFSPTNVRRMRAFYLAYPERDASQREGRPAEENPILPQAVGKMKLGCNNMSNVSPSAPSATGQTTSSCVPWPMADIPWGHNTLLVERLSTHEERLWYARQTLEHGWSRAVLAHQIDSDLFHRQGQAVTNFEHTLPPPDSDLVKRLLKDPYAFDFLDVGSQMTERKLETRLIDRLRHLLLELGRGFAFVGSRYRIEVGGRQMRHPQDAPSIGLILCRERNRLVAEYTLQDVIAPMGVATYQTLPEDVRKRLPSPEQLVAGLSEES